MARLASKADFEDPGGLYWPPYFDAPFYWQRADEIRRTYSGTVLVAGCGWGFTVRHLVDMGMDAWGCDASQYSINKANEVLPVAVRSRIVLCDVTVRSQVNSLRTAAGLPGNQRFQAAITEDMLPVMSDTEIASMLTELRRAVSGDLLHIATCAKPDLPGDLDRRDSGLVWRSQAQWKAIVTPDPVLDTETGVIL